MKDILINIVIQLFVILNILGPATDYIGINLVALFVFIFAAASFIVQWVNQL